jgi:hypothetical protein
MIPVRLVLFAAGMALSNAAEVPFNFVHNQVVIEGFLNGSGPLNFIIDTGTRASIIDITLVRRLNLPVGAEVPVTGAGTGRSTAHRTTCRLLRIGDLNIRDLDAHAVDLAGISHSLGRPVHGVLGYNFFASRIVQIDYFVRRIRILGSAPAPRADDRRSAAFPMIFRENSVLPVLADCLINGTRLPVTLDTGSSLGLILFPGAVERLGLSDLARNGMPLHAAGYVGPVRLRKGWVRSFMLKTIDLGAVEVAYVEKGLADAEPVGTRAGNLGNAVLQDFVVTLDYPGRLVTLESRAEPGVE